MWNIFFLDKFPAFFVLTKFPQHLEIIWASKFDIDVKWETSDKNFL